MGKDDRPVPGAAKDGPRGVPDVAPSSTPPQLRDGQEQAPAVSSAAQVADFLRNLKNAPQPAVAGRGRLVFAMDATMSRQPTWDMALALQAEMFEAVEAVGGLDVQLVYFRGHGECRASKWVSDAAALSELMTSVECRGGYTQIGKVLSQARRETEAHRIAALVYIGDAMEEIPDELCGRAGELALHGVPAFLFQEGTDLRAEQTFREIARITRGAWFRFDQGSAAQLLELLTAVAVYAAGGTKALALSRSQAAQRLLEQLKR